MARFPDAQQIVDAFRAEGLNVYEMDGWRGRCRCCSGPHRNDGPHIRGWTDWNGITIHHTAGPMLSGGAALTYTRNILIGGNGNDLLVGADIGVGQDIERGVLIDYGEVDRLTGGAGADTLIGGAGDDVLGGVVLAAHAHGRGRAGGAGRRGRREYLARKAQVPAVGTQRVAAAPHGHVRTLRIVVRFVVVCTALISSR